MPATKTLKRVRAHTISVVAVTVSFVAVAVVLAALVTRVVTTMASATNEIDDARAEQIAHTVISELEEILGAATKDHAAWYDAQATLVAPASGDWVYDHWGKATEEYTLYDGAFATRPDGSTLFAFAKGQPFDPHAYFGEAIRRQIESAAPSGQPAVNFVKTANDVMLVASQRLRSSGAVLSLYKELSPAFLDKLADEHELEGLRLQPVAERGSLSVPIHGIDSAAIAYIAWPSKAPGNVVLDKVYPDVVVAAGILVLFLVAVLLAGAIEAQRLRQSAQAARFDASHDSLSGLFNRRGLLGALDRLESPAPATLYLIDLDGFKAVNDAWGHAVGDKLILMVADALKACHPEIIAVGRLGGDEFALLHSGTAGFREIETTILALFAKPFRIDGRTIEVGASIGVVARTGKEDPMELLRRADVALYRAKENGKGHAVGYVPELDQERQRIVDLEGELRQAINSGAVEPVFQPLVSASTGKVLGVEALARWQTSAGSVSPEVFIPLAEKSGLIDALGMHMLRASIRHAKGWPGLALSVNVSPIQLCNPDFPSHVMTILREFDFDAQHLTLEITEGVLMTNPEQARRSIDQLRQIGIKFALDDFGCGYASIGALRQFGFDRMKLDRSLVSGLEQNIKGIDVLRATVALAKALDIPVTAEGIENTHQAEILRETGCDLLQGYLVGRPMSAADITGTLAQQGVAA
ncbi:putative bifunctional diguanylate cyclase/phosphodiesterase [Agrobacterium salinitolerans]